MFEEILKLDSKLFLFLNNLGTTKFDAFWLSLSKIEANILMYLFLILLFFYILKSLVQNFYISSTYFFIIALMITITDQGANFFKDSFQRLRPCYNESISDSLRLVKGKLWRKIWIFFGTCL